MELTLKERMEDVAKELERVEAIHDNSADEYYREGWADQSRISRTQARAYGHAKRLVKQALEDDADQAEHGKPELRMVCPLMSRPKPIDVWGIQPVCCLGPRCGMYALCRGRIDLSGKDIKITPPAVPGL